jgi:RHS repeat-associated protein
MSVSSATRSLRLPRPVPPLHAVTPLRKPGALFLALVLLIHWSVPALAQGASAPSPSSTNAAAPAAAASPAAPLPGGASEAADKAAPGQETPGTTTMSAGEGDGVATSPGVTSAQAFQTDLFTGAATAEIPIIVVPGTAGVAPKIVLRYNSGTVDELRPKAEGYKPIINNHDYTLPPDQAQWTGLGWTLDAGGMIIRDLKGTAEPNDDTFRLVFNGASHDLVLIDTDQRIYHTKDETFWRVQYHSSDDSWTLTTKDGTIHRFGSTAATRAVLLMPSLTYLAYKYGLDEVRTTGGTAVRYTYAKYVAIIPGTGYTYDQAMYPETITYTYQNGIPVGPAREVRFHRAPRNDWTDNSLYTSQAFFERERLDAIEVRVGASLVRKYALTYDYSVDRDAAYTWGGGATGDLTLRFVTLYGTDGSSALPSLSFSYYGDGPLATATSGTGGTVTYTYDSTLHTRPLYTVSKTYDPQHGCDTYYNDWGIANDLGHPSCGGWGARLLGYALDTAQPDSVPLYSAYASHDYGFCWDLLGSRTTGPPECAGYASFVGYVRAATAPGTVRLYLESEQSDDSGEQWVNTYADPQYCAECPTLGYAYSAPVDRHRVTRHETSDGRGTTSPVTYAYGPVELYGTEFRGHAWVRAIDPAGHYTDTWFHQDDAKKGRAYQVETRSSAGALFTKIESSWNTATPYPGVTLVSLAQTDGYAYDGQASATHVRKTFEYDAYGNTTLARHWGDVDVSGDEHTEVLEYAYNTAAYLVGLPKHSTVLDAGNGTAAQAWFYYDAAGSSDTPPTLGRLTKKCQWLNGGTNPCVELSYNAYGNIATTKDARGNTTTTTYETTYHTFPATVTTPATPNAPNGLPTTATYDERFGVIRTMTDPNGQPTTREYDTFGRLQSVRNALNETKTITYPNLGNPATQHVRTEVPDGNGGTLWTEVYYDGLGRTYLVKKSAPGGAVVVQTTYDARGLVASTTLPHFNTPSALAVTNTYDPLGRVTRTGYPDGTFEMATHTHWTTTATDRNTHSRSTVKDAYGRVRQVTEPATAAHGPSTTTYEYDPLGRLTAVRDTATPPNVTTMVYDTLGRKIQMTEPNMGTWTYEYDANGNLLKQSDAKHQELTFTYDALNRVATKTYPGLAVAPLHRAVKTWAEGSAPLYRGGVCVANTGGTCVGGDVRLEAGLGALVGYLKTAPDTGTVAAYKALCYADAGGTCTGWSLSLTPSDDLVGYLALGPPSGAVALTQSGGLLYQGLGGTPSAYLWSAPLGQPRTDHLYAPTPEVPPGYVSEGLLGYLRQDPDLNTASVVRYVNATTGSHYYSTASDAPSGYTAEATLGYVDTTSGTGLTLLARHYNATTGDYLLDTSTTPPSGYTYQATVGYLRLQPPASAGTVTFTYDTGSGGKGRRTGMVDLAGTASYAYDALGRATEVTRTVDDVAYATTTTYTKFGAVATVTTHRDGELLTYTYDAGGQVTSVTSSTGTTYASNITYNAAGQLTSLTYGNGAVRTHTYEPTTLRLATLVTTRSGTPLQSFGYQYDGVGNIRTLGDQGPGGVTQTFAYDERNRLIQAGGAYGTHTYTYSAIGNIDTKAGITYAYGATAQTCGRRMPHAVTSTSDGTSYSYDCNGNLIAEQGPTARSIVWDADNKPVSVTHSGATTTFAYSGDGARVRKQGVNGLIRYAGGLEDHVTDGTQAKHIGVAGLRIATRVVGGIKAGVYYTHGDHLGSLNVLTNANGDELQRLTYLPYGETHTNQGNAEYLDFHQRRYTGQEQDPETGLYFYNARYYNPTLGRFLSPDSIVPSPLDPQGLNRYSYVDNNPINRIDPSGHSWLSKLWNKFRHWAKRHPGTATWAGIAIRLSGVEAAVGFPVADVFFSQTQTGRYIIAAQIIVGTAVATFYCAGCGAWLAGALIGEIIGGAAGAYSAYAAGGDISQGLLFGVVVGGATGALAGGINAEVGSFWAQVGKGFAAGAIKGAGVGAAGGYAGGAGDWNSIIMGVALGAGIGGALGAAKPLLFGANVGSEPELQRIAAQAQNALETDYSHVTMRAGGALLPPPGYAGFTLGNTVFLKGGLSGPDLFDVLVEELAHTSQYRMWGFVPFLVQYVIWHFQYGYDRNPFERAAWGGVCLAGGTCF